MDGREGGLLMVLIIAFLVGYLVWRIGKAVIAWQEANEEFERENPR